MSDKEALKLSTTSNFTLLGEYDKERLGFNGAVVSVNELINAGFKLGPTTKDKCRICSQTESKRIWREVSICCNNVSGSIWFCSVCSRAHILKARDQGVWFALSKTLKPYSNISAEYRNPLNIVAAYLPSKEDFESAYRGLMTHPGEDISFDAVLDQMEINVKEKGLSLKNTWRMITEENIKIWSKVG